MATDSSGESPVPGEQMAQMRRRSLQFVVLIGVVSLFADMTYEGARSITGPFLAVLGASAATVGVVGGLGEFIGYAFRLVSGYLADRTGRYWPMTIAGYVINLLAVPALALAGRWQVAAVLIMAERFGKAVRNPPRDVMLSHATASVGRGWGFGLHEALDQIGAIVGPLIVAGVLYLRQSYTLGFAVLLVPALLALAVLATARWLYPAPRDLERTEEKAERELASDLGGGPAGAVAVGGRLPPRFWTYMAFVSLSVAGYAHFQLISYHFELTRTVLPDSIPVLFSIAMGVDALVALWAGRLFDRSGMKALMVIPLLSLPIAPLVFSRGFGLALAGVVLWGAVMGVQETIMRAAIADLAPAERRGLAYGVFNTAYGLAWFAGSAVMGLLYSVSWWYLVGFSIVLELAAVPVLIRLAGSRSASPA